MRKTDKRIENSIRDALTEVCELALESVVGFKWLTHLVADYKTLPKSLSVMCVFGTNDELSTAQETLQDDIMCRLIKEKLSAANINIKDIRQHVRFDTEEACDTFHDGKWHERFK